MAVGGLTKGKSHAEGGIPMVVKSTGQKIEVEGGEGILNKYAMSNKKKFEFEGEMLTTCQIASRLNQKKGDGVRFECDDVEGKKYMFREGGEVGSFPKKKFKTNSDVKVIETHPDFTYQVLDFIHREDAKLLHIDKSNPNNHLVYYTTPNSVITNPKKVSVRFDFKIRPTYAWVTSMEESGSVNAGVVRFDNVSSFLPNYLKIKQVEIFDAKNQKPSFAKEILDEILIQSDSSVKGVAFLGGNNPNFRVFDLVFKKEGYKEKDNIYVIDKKL